jgi:hypothetical protein
VLVAPWRHWFHMHLPDLPGTCHCALLPELSCCALGALRHTPVLLCTACPTEHLCSCTTVQPHTLCKAVEAAARTPPGATMLTRAMQDASWRIAGAGSHRAASGGRWTSRSCDRRAHSMAGGRTFSGAWHRQLGRPGIRRLAMAVPMNAGVKHSAPGAVQGAELSRPRQRVKRNDGARPFVTARAQLADSGREQSRTCLWR